MLQIGSEPSRRSRHGRADVRCATGAARRTRCSRLPSRPVEPYRRRRFLRRPSRTTVIELTVFLGLAIAYNFVRSAPGTNATVAIDHAHDIIAAEGWVFDHLEVPLNEWMVSVTPVAVVSCYIYALLHYAATPIVFFLSRRRGGWQYWRGYWALVVASGHRTGRLRDVCRSASSPDARSRDRRRDESLLAIRLVGFGCVGSAGHR